MKKYIVIIAALLSALGMKAQTEINGLWYNLHDWDNTAGVYVYSPSATLADEVTIPSTVEYDSKTYTVNSIEQWYYPDKRVSLVLPSTMTTVYLSSFQSEIGTLTIPATASIDVNAHSNVEAFALSGDHAKYTVKDGVLFDKDQTTLVAFPGLKDKTSYTVPSTVTVIGRSAFTGNDKLEYLTLPEGLLEIQESAMSNMYRLNTCNIPSKLKTIGNSAFNGCQLVFADNTLTLPKTLKSLGNYALDNAFKYTSSTTVVIPRELGSDLDGGTNLYIGENAIRCNSIKSEILKPISVHWGAFWGVEAIFIPDGTKDLYLQKEGWNYNNGSKLRGGGVSYSETVAAIAITDVLDYDNRTVSAKMSTTTEGAVIRYKITTDINDNSDPTQWDIYDGGTLSMVSSSGEYSWNTYYLRAVAFKDGMNTSAIASRSYYYNDYVCSRPTINCIDNSTTLTITSPDADATIYYTTDGSDPTAKESATCFKYTGAITLTKNATYRAIAAKEGKFPSDISDERRVTWFPVDPVVAEQVVVDGQPCLKLTTPTEGAEIWYSYNWYSEDYRYEKPIPASRNQTIYFIGKKDGYNSTNWETYRMNYDDYTLCESPSVEISNEARTVTLSTTETGADIWYLIDKDYNSNTYPIPNANGSTKYDGKPFRPWTNGLLKVIVAKEGKVNSDVYQTNLDEAFRLRYVDFEPVLGEEENEFKLAFSYPETGINGVKIYYYFSGIDWTEYTGTPVNVPANTYVYAQARAEGYVDSWQRDFYVSSDRYTVSQPNVTAISQDKKLRVTCETKGVTIYYTTDGTDPTTESPNHFEINEYYTPDVDVPLNGTYKFMAAKKGMYNSSVSTIVITDWYMVPKVNIIPFAKDGKMMVKLTCKDEWKYKYYWAYSGNVNDEVITANSEYTMYQDMEIEPDREIYFTAYLDGYRTNWVSKWVNRGEYTCSAPNITVNADTLVNMTTPTAGAKIKYTLDGNDPSTSWTAKEYSEPFKIDKNYTIKAVAVKDSMFNSGIQTNYYNNFRVANVEFEQIVDDGQPKMKLTTATPGATIRYSFNDWNIENCKVYTEPIAMSRGQWIHAIAQKDGYNDSDWQEKNMDYSDYTNICATAGMYTDATNRTVTLTTSEPGGEIYYIIDTDGNSNPTRSSTKYDGKPFRPAVYGTLKAIVFAKDKICSDINSFGLDEVFRLREVTFEPQYEVVEDEEVYKMHFSYRDTTITNLSDVEIYYWNDGEEQKKYDGTPVTCTLGTYLYAYARKPGYADSWQRSTYVSKDIYRLRQPNVNARSEARTLTVTWDDEDAKVYWTENGEDPTASNSKTLDKYNHPDIKLTHNGTYKFMAVKDKMLSSPINTVTISDWFRVPDVKIIPFGENDKFMVKLECEGYNNIYWAYDDEVAMDAVVGNTLYTSPFEVTEGKRIYATAWKDGYNENWTVSDWLYRNNYTCTVPTIAVNRDTIVTITNNQAGAKIRYTLDGSNPTIYTGTEYKAPFKLLNNATIKAIAYQDSLLTSSVRTHQYTGYRVAEVKISTFIENSQIMVKLETQTPDAKIYYNFNERNNTITSNLLYTQPFVVANGYRVQANAVKDGYTEAGWTSTDWFDYESYTATQPIITILPDTTVFMSADAGAEIYYTTDGSTPDENSTKYENPFKLTRNSVIKAFAVVAGKINSSISENDYNGFHVKAPVFAQNGITMTITTATPEATIYYAYESEGNSVNKNSHKYTGPFDVMDNSTIRAFAVRDGWYDSDVSTISTGDKITCPMVEAVSYDGHFLTLKAIDDATIWYTTNGNDPRDNSNKTVSWIYEYKTPIAINSTGQIKAIAIRNYMNPSDIATFDINFYAGENGTTLEKAGVLEEVMAWSDVTTITEFNIEGPLNQKDLAFIKEHMTSLQHLDMSKTTIEDGTLPDHAFSGLPIISFTSPENITQVGSGIFTDCPELAAVRWNTTTKLPDNSFDANHNPNLLLFVRFEIAAPSHAAVDNQIINGTAQSIVLVDDYTSNFYCPERFYAKSIKYTHKFAMTSGNGGGWESFTLPFTPTRFIHESKGELLPFKSYETQENQESYRPFWLRSLNELGFEDVGTMEANKPYIICMPNNERYATRFRLAGNVTFSATDTYVPVTSPEPAEKGNVMFVPNFLHRDKEIGILAINLETEGEYIPGSAFLDNMRGLRPFEAYARSIGVARQAIRIDDSDLFMPTAIQDVELLDVSGNAIISVYNLSGNLVIRGKRSEVMPKLTNGVYIIDGKKMVVK
ncbi:MAG: chitobiase/beta-hexosaminidase C-terminal domain-containing protein [Prevotella sp.]|nr:chitobiase/beta-hexosaminidase C-terminal domain-containing protein [Prevotella sp.]